MQLSKYSIGVGDRFGRQGKAQLAALIKAKENDVDITPVWNKSHREHEIIGTHPHDVRQEADSACKETGWNGSYFVDADHVNMSTISLFMDTCDFFTIDVADFIGEKPDNNNVKAFVEAHRCYLGDLVIPGIEEAFHTATWTVLSRLR